MVLRKCQHLANVLLFIEFAVGQQLDHVASPHKFLPDESAVLYEVILPHDLP
jgi:hypothetical protein